MVLISLDHASATIDYDVGYTVNIARLMIQNSDTSSIKSWELQSLNYHGADLHTTDTEDTCLPQFLPHTHTHQECAGYARGQPSAHPLVCG